MNFLILVVIAAINTLSVLNQPIAQAINAQISSSLPKQQLVLSASTSSPSAAKSTSLPVYKSRFNRDQSTGLPSNPAEKLAPHLYRTHVKPEPNQGSADEILNALDVYRSSRGIGTLQKDPALCSLAQNRANEQDKNGGLDSHAGFKAFLEDKNHWQQLNVHGLGENSAWNYQVSAKTLIEQVFSSDPEHQSNQLNPAWSLACAAVSGKTVDIIFGRR